MPLLVLSLVALAGGSLVTLLALRYPTPVIGQEPSGAAAEMVAEEAVKRPWLRRMLARRVDPRTATGFALTLALGLAIAGGLVVGMLAYLTRSSGTLVAVDNGAGEWGLDHSTSWSTHVIQLVTDLGGTWFVLAVALVVCVAEYVRVPNRWIPVFLLTVLLGEVALVNAIKGSSTGSGRRSTRLRRRSAPPSRAVTLRRPPRSTPPSRSCWPGDEARGRGRFWPGRPSPSRSALRPAACCSASTGCRT